jgi:hypothetical protein
VPAANPIVGEPASGVGFGGVQSDAIYAPAAPVGVQAPLAGTHNTPQQVALLVLIGLAIIALLQLGGFKFVFTAGMGR